MSTRPNRAARRTRKRAAWDRANREPDLTAREAMRPVVGKAPRVSYAGSGADGYRSDWSRPGNVGGEAKPIVIDRRWSDTATRQGTPRV